MSPRETVSVLPPLTTSETKASKGVPEVSKDGDIKLGEPIRHRVYRWSGPGLHVGPRKNKKALLPPPAVAMHQPSAVATSKMVFTAVIEQEGSPSEAQAAP